MAKLLGLAAGCALLLLLHTNPVVAGDSAGVKPAWSYNCKNSECVKVEADPTDDSKNVCLDVCRLFCGPQVGTLWPYPSRTVNVMNTLIRFDPEKISFSASPFKSQAEFEYLQDLLEKKQGPQKERLRFSAGSAMKIEFDVVEAESSFDLNTDESYQLKISKGANEDVLVLITARNAFGARYGLITLSQLVVFDNFRFEMLIPGDVFIDDAPAYKHRGVVLDTSRNYFSVDAIKRTLHAMSLSKLNVFHWHVTDSHSFPLVVANQSQLHTFGAYQPHKIYTPADVREIVAFGRVRGIAVIPEFDAPAHVGEGWQKTDLTACFNAQPWQNYCVEPPCGQLDPTQSRLYDVLEDIYRTMWTDFGAPHLFHMGGDEVSVGCWNSSARIRRWMEAQGWQLQEKDFMRLWGHFQDNAKSRLDAVRGAEGRQRPIVLWTSRLTELPFVDEYVDKATTIIQIWTKGDDPKVADILKLGFRIIVSNYDALYLDCGAAGWVTDGQNWCAPYIGWQKVYDNRMERVAGKAEYQQQVLGAEAALWSEQADEQSLDGKLWPRASALAERLWTNPKTTWRQADQRMLMHREELVRNGIAAEALQPEWCLQNEGNCQIVKTRQFVEKAIAGN